MQPIFLDAAGPVLFAGFALAFIIAMALIVLAEGFILYFLSYKPLGPSLKDALIINVASGLAGFLVTFIPNYDDLPGYPYSMLGLLFLLTLLIEGAVLWKLRKRETSLRTILISTAVINVATYGIMLGFMIIDF